MPSHNDSKAQYIAVMCKSPVTYDEGSIDRGGRDRGKRAIMSLFSLAWAVLVLRLMLSASAGEPPAVGCRLFEEAIFMARS